jgi:sec-independent protein translocase protein TatA
MAHGAQNMFGKLGWVEILVIGALVLLIFGGRGKISAMMGDVAKGIKSFRKGMKDPDVDTSQTTSGAMINEPINVTPEKEKSKV